MKIHIPIKLEALSVIVISVFLLWIIIGLWGIAPLWFSIGVIGILIIADLIILNIGYEFLEFKK